MSDQPITPDPAPVVFPSDGTQYAAPGAEAAPQPEPAPVDPVPAPTTSVVVAPPGGEILTLPSGYHVALRATRSVRARDRKGLFAGVDFSSENPDKAALMDTGMVILGNVQKLMITAWDVRDFDDATGEPVGDVLPIPSQTTDDVLGGLSLEDANALDKATEEIQKVLLPNFGVSPDASSPTPPSAG